MVDDRSAVGGRQAADVTYDPDWFDLLERVEDRHFWFAARRKVVGALAAQAMTSATGRPWVMEIGCGNGGLLDTLCKACPTARVIGTDLYREGLDHARRRRSTAHLLQSDLRAPPFAGTFQLIGLFDVLEHIPDDRGVLRCVHELLAPGGAMLLTVPAHTFLWSYFDEVSHHQRRYGLSSLKTLIGDAGFRIEYVSQFMGPLFPLMWLTRRLARLRPGGGAATESDTARAAGELRIVPGFNAVMNALLTMESRFIARRAVLPIGTSLVALARKDR